jgi:tetratricopeptide (TPR) repeat protein
MGAGIGAALLLLAACGRHPEPAAHRTASLAAASPLVQTAVATQESLLVATLPAAPGAHDVLRYFHYSSALRDPERREAAQESFFAEWAAAPDQIFFVELGVVYARWLGRHDERAALLTAAAGPDTNAAMYHFVKGRLGWSTQPDADEAFRGAADRAAGSEPLLAAWSLMRAARIAGDRGEIEGALGRFRDLLVPAWTAGGPILTGALWMEISRLARKDGRLDDALVAAAMAEACATTVGNGYLRTRARLSLGRAHLQRGRFAAAVDTFAACYAVAADSGYTLLRAQASGLAAMAANASGDLDRATREVQRVFQIATAGADTNGMVRAAVSLADCLRRDGDFDGAEHWLARSDTLNAAHTQGDLSRFIREQRAKLLNQTGRYAAAESLRVVIAKAANRAEDHDHVLQQQINLVRQGVEIDRPDQAYRALARAQELAAQYIPRSLTFDMRLHLSLAAAQLYARQGEYRLADTELHRAAERVVPTNLRANWFVADTAGQVAQEAGDIATASQAYRRCAALADTIGEPDLIRRSRVHLSAALLSDGRFAAAESLVAADIHAPGYWSRLNARLVSAMARAGVGDHAAALAEFASADTVLGTDPPADLAARLALETGRSLAALDRARAAFAQFTDARRFLDAPSAAAATELGQSFNRDIRYEVAEAILGLLREHPELAAGTDAVTVSRQIAAWSRHTTPLAATGPRLEFFIGPRRAFAWATAGSASPFHWAELIATSELVALTGAVTTDLAYPGRELDAQVIERLSAALLQPLVGRWPHGASLEIAPDRWLTALPWAALPWPETGVAILDRGPLVLTVGMPRPRVPHRGSGLLAIGVNDLTDTQAARLAQAEAEVQAIAAAWQGGPVELRVGAEGSLAGLLPDGLAGYRAIHFSSHAQVYEGAAGHATIHVAGDQGLPLTVGQIMSATTDAELVYLSNCDGARRHRSAGRGVLSFADAFLAAGAEGVIATSVRVDDDASRVLAEGFYRHWLSGMERAAALRAALLELKERKPRWSHPFYWAFTNFYTRPSA